MNDPSSSRIYKESVFHDADEDDDVNDNNDKRGDGNKDQYDNDEDYDNDNNNQEFTEENIMKTSAMNVDDNTIYFETNVKFYFYIIIVIFITPILVQMMRKFFYR